MNAPWSWLLRLALVDPSRVARKLEAFEEAGIVQPAPNVWQLTLGVLRMWHRVLFRSDCLLYTSPSPRDS